MSEFSSNEQVLLSKKKKYNDPKFTVTLVLDLNKKKKR